LHDNRAADLRDLLTRLGHGGAEKLLPAQVADLLVYLQSL
jgi:hypothetical protein